MMIFLSAKQGGGKTSLTEMLQKRFPQSYYIKFAKPLYEIQDLMYSYLGKYGVDYCEKDGPFLQFIGAHFRKKDKNIWCNIARKQIEDFLSKNKNVCVLNDDMRHENEFDIFNDFPYPILRIRLECSEDVRKERSGPLWRPDVNHESEVGLDEYSRLGKFDFYINTEKRSKDEAFQFLNAALANYIEVGKFINKGDYHDIFG